jgi:hypothetical protein
MDELARKIYPEAYAKPEAKAERKKTDESLIMRFAPPNIATDGDKKVAWDPDVLETGEGLVQIVGNLLQTACYQDQTTRETKRYFKDVRFKWPNDNLSGEASIRSSLSPVSAYVDCPGFYHPTRNEIKVIIGMANESRVLIYPREYSPVEGAKGNDATAFNAASESNLVLRGHILVVSGPVAIRITQGLVYFLPWQNVMQDWLVQPNPRCEEVD